MSGPGVTTSAAAVTPRQERSRRERMRGPVLVIGGLAALTLALHLRDPHQHASWGLCPSAALGVYCPGCGGLRAVNDLTHGDVGAAASSNLLLVVLMPALVALLALWAADRWRGRTRSIDGRRARAVLIGLGVVAAAFTVLRNLPAGAWLAP